MGRFAALTQPRSRGAWALVGLTAIVALLGYQQYRWIDRVAEAQGKTNREKLEASLKAFADDFDTEITRAHVVFTGLAAQSTANVLRKARERLQIFKQLSAYPGLIASVETREGVPEPFIIDPGPPPALVVPASFARMTSQPVAGMRYLTAEPLLAANRGAQVQVGTGAGMRFESIPLGIRVVLDQTYIVSTLFRRLLDRHLGFHAEQHYDLLVRSAKTGEVVLRAGGDTSQPWDYSLRIFAVRPDCLADQADGTSIVMRGSITTDIASLVRQTGKCSDAQSGASGAWIMNVRVRPSLAEATTFARRQNLAISFGVLLVLVATAAILFVSAHRASELAAMHKQFAAGISHELRTPLSIISSASENLADGVVENADQARQYGRMIHTHSEQLAAMIENALWFARKDGREELERGEVDVEELVSTAVGTCSGMLEEAGVKLERDIEPGLPAIRGNRTLLLHGLQNLLTNVARYGRSGKWARVQVARKGNQVVFTIEDRGDGIPPDEVARVFEPFYRGKGAKRATLAGLGLGLSLVRTIVESHEGKIELRSKRNLGTTIVFAVPAFDSHKSAAHS